MRPFFTFLSIIYISGIFLFAGSPLVERFARFNPYSLLHIPVYGILTVLIIFSIFPLKFEKNVPNDLNVPREMHPLSRWGDLNVLNERNASTHIRVLIPGLVALVVAIADEIYQAYIPIRNASVIDVILDAFGIFLALFLVSRTYKPQRTLKTQLTH